MQNCLRSTLAALTRCYPLMKGGGKLANLPPMRRLSAKPEVVDARLRGGGVLRVPINDYVGRPIYWTGDFDRRVSWALRRILRTGDAVVDIGANLGVYTIRAARLVGPAGIVHAIEPQHDVAELQEQSLALNGLTNTTVHRVGLSDHDGDAKLGYRPDDTGGRGIVPDDATRNTLDITVREATGFLDALPIPADKLPVRLVKLDVEGHEPRVLAAARPWLDRHPAHCVLFESHAEGGPFLDRPEVRTLVSLGYRFAALRAGWWGVTPVPITTSTDAARCNAIDYLAVHEAAAERDNVLGGMVNRRGS